MMARRHVLRIVAGIVSMTAILPAATFIRWGSTGTPLDGLTVTWRSDAASSTIKWGYTASYEKGTFDGTRHADYTGYLYDYTFPALEADRTIYYAIYDGSWTAQKTFSTAPDPAGNRFSFIAGGDSRGSSSTSPPTGWQAVSGLMEPEDVDLCLYMSDIINTGTITQNWTWWYEYDQGFIGKNLIYHSYGNHDAGTIYPNQFVLPGNEKYYSFEYANTKFICLDSQTPSSSTQYQWLLGQLQNNTKTWTVIWFHKPFYTGSSHSTDMWSYFDTWWKAFDDYGVDVVIGGHTHNYMRSKPINRNVSTSAAVAAYGSGPGQGRLQIVSGGFGAPLSSASTGWFVETTASSYNYCRFDIDGNTLILNTYNGSGTKIDSLTITKGPDITLMPTALAFDATMDGADPAGQDITVTAVGGQSLSGLTATGNAAWLSTSVGSGTTSRTVAVTAAVSGLAAGTYDDTVTVQVGSITKICPVRLTVMDPSCSIAAWNDPAFPDSAWPEGPAELGYGDGDEATVVSYGGSGSNKYTTTYFRHAFTCADPAAVTALTLGLNYDDGVAVYLNGTEVARRSLPSGTLTYGTFASSHEGGTFEAVDITSRTGLLAAGTNVLAAEVHQLSLTSSDISFDLDLKTQSSTLISRGAAWRYAAWGAEPEPALVCTTATDFVLAPAALEFSASMDGADPAGQDITVTLVAGASLSGLTAAGTAAWLAATVGSGTTSRTVTVTVAISGLGAGTYDDTVMVRAGSITRTCPIRLTVMEPNCFMAAWNHPAFPDSAWPAGPAELGYGDSDEATVVSYGGSGSNKYTTTYFRHAFTCADPSAVSALTLEVNYDDAVAVYLNGTEVSRLNLPSGTLTYGTFASGNHEGGTFAATDISSQAGLLAAGTNVLAAEVHQVSTTSSDISFDLDLKTQSSTLISRGAAWRYAAWGAEPAPALVCTTTSAIGHRWSPVQPERYGLTGAAGIVAGSIPARARRISVFDHRGTLVVSLQVDTGVPVTWNGCDRAGAPVRPGVYVVRAEAGGRTYVSTAVVVR